MFDPIKIADEADVIISGYAFLKKDEGITTVVNLNSEGHTALILPSGEVRESNMDPIEQVIALDYFNKAREYLYDEDTLETENKADGQILPKQALHDLTLALIYLTRFTEGRGKKTDFREAKEFKAWKSYDWDTLDQLNEEEYIIDRHGNKSLWLTEEGVSKAKEILNNLGIQDWEK